MDERHHLTFGTYEEGKLSLDEYLDRTVFYESRSFTREQFRDFMFGQSKPYPEMIAYVAGAEGPPRAKGRRGEQRGAGADRLQDQDLRAVQGRRFLRLLRALSTSESRTRTSGGLPSICRSPSPIGWSTWTTGRSSWRWRAASA